MLAISGPSQATTEPQRDQLALSLGETAQGRSSRRQRLQIWVQHGRGVRRASAQRHEQEREDQRRQSPLPVRVWSREDPAAGGLSLRRAFLTFRDASCLIERSSTIGGRHRGS